MTSVGCVAQVLSARCSNATPCSRAMHIFSAKETKPNPHYGVTKVRPIFWKLSTQIPRLRRDELRPALLHLSAHIPCLRRDESSTRLFELFGPKPPFAQWVPVQCRLRGPVAPPPLSLQPFKFLNPKRWTKVKNANRLRVFPQRMEFAGKSKKDKAQSEHHAKCLESCV